MILSEKAGPACDGFVMRGGNQILGKRFTLERLAFEGKRDRPVRYISNALADFNASWKKNGVRFMAVESEIPDSAGAMHDLITQAASRNIDIHYV